MKTNLYPALLLAAALAAGGCQSTPATSAKVPPANVTVNFQDPDKFTDVRDSMGGGASPYYLDVLRDHLKIVAARRLSAGQKLDVTFTDIDLAGDIVPGQLDNIRIVKAIYIPRMDLSFQLREANGTVIKEGVRHLTDMDFLQNIRPIDQNQPLSYDKQLLERWVQREFP